jgi:hypothetical protein
MIPQQNREGAMRVQRLITVGGIVLLSGCAAVWGKTYKIEFQSSSSITINYDPSLTNLGEIQNVAQAHCAEYGKDALPQGSKASPWGLDEISFSCIRRT